MVSSGKKGRLVVVSGASGTGKTTLCQDLKEKLGLRFSVSATTRNKREGEVEARDYYFLSDRDFDRLVEGGEFLEWAQVHGHRYGTLKKPIEDSLNKGENVLLDVDTQGALNIKKNMADAVLIFIKPPSVEELRRRLEKRGTDSPAEIKGRIERALGEIAQSDQYDHVVVNLDLEKAKKELRDIIQKVIN